MARVGGWRVDQDGGAMTVCDVGRLTTVGLSDQMGWMTCRWLVTKMAGL